MTSAKTMIMKLQGLVGTKDVNKWEDQFIQDIAKKTDGGRHALRLSDKQVEIIESIHNKHFA